MTSKILIITGPTASGKSGLASRVAQKTGGVIINADSQQLFRELRIISARPTPEEEALAPHKLYGILSASERSSAGIWLKFAKMEIDWALSQGKLPIVVGGTGLYIKALMEGLNEIPDILPEVRGQAKSDYEAMGKDAFAARMAEIDPIWAEKLKVLDKQRLIRAYEVWLGSGKPLSYWQNSGIIPPYNPDYFKIYQLDIKREELYRHCDERFIKMIEQGAVEEVKSLLAMKLPADMPAMKSVGIKELGQYLGGQISLEIAIAQAQQATRNYAKRQLTWFRHQLQGKITLINPGDKIPEID